MEEKKLLSEYTTLRVGGPAARIVTATTRQQIVDVALAAWSDQEPLLVLGGGSNVLIDDDGFDGTVLRVASRGIEMLPVSEGQVRLRAQAGEGWDALVVYAVSRGLAGIEALSGIPGLVGAAPMQNIGAYGQELSSVLHSIEFLDRDSGEIMRLAASELGLGYRTSALKQRAGIVLSVELTVHSTEAERVILGEALAFPLEYRQLADALGAQLGDRFPLQRVREAVLDLRASKGMLLSAQDHDSVSAGSFFTNPIVTEHTARGLPDALPRWPLDEEPAAITIPLERAHYEVLEHRPTPGPRRVKLSAAWLIENAGIHRGFALPGSGAAVSSKHTLALTNRGDATAADVAQLARFIRGRVQAEFGIVLQPEPVLVGIEL